MFDRSAADLIGYASLFGLDAGAARNASMRYRFHPTVFFFSGWPEIYATDDERTMSFDAASRFGEDLRRTYAELGCRPYLIRSSSARR